jgi:hypothetical protein
MIGTRVSLGATGLWWPNASSRPCKEFGQCVKCLVKGYNGSIRLRALKPSIDQPWAGCCAPSCLCGLCRSAWEPFNSLMLARLQIDCEWVILVRLHHEIASNDTRCSCCKPVVLVTLEGCHLLDGLVEISIEACKENCTVLQRRDCEGYCAHPVGAAKSNSSRACRWATLTWFVGFLQCPTCGLGVVLVSRWTTKWTVDTTGTSVLVSTWTLG